MTPVDRLGVWLSARAVHRHVDLAGKRVGDFGCGYDAWLVRSVLDRVASAQLIDLRLAPDLRSHPKVRATEGPLEDVLAELEDASLDVVLCVSVLEHLCDPQAALDEFRRLVADGGTVLINVPTWLGKWFLELSAFRLGLSPAEEMDDHKRYYDPRDLWPMLVKAGFRPRDVTCRRHKLGLNTFAVCRAPQTARSTGR